MSPEHLKFQISLLLNAGFRFSTLRQAMERPRPKTAVLTFDDGYSDNVTEALPVLETFGIPATIFVITGDVGRRDVVWEEAGEKLPADLLDWHELARLQRHGWEVASHARQHVHLARYPEKDQFELISDSLVDIERNLGNKPVSFAYPYGSYSETTKKVLRKAGIRFAVTTNRLHLSVEPRDPLELCRCSVGGGKIHHFAKSVVGFSKAIGAAPTCRAIGKHFFDVTAGRLVGSGKSVPAFGTANDHVVTRQ